MKKLQNISYGEYSENLLDLYLPDSESFPVLVYFHGGGLEGGNKDEGFIFIDRLVEMGIAVASVEYRMYPSARYPDFIEDAARAVSWAFERIGDFGRCDGIYVGGTSAGGYISMMLCFDKRWLGKYSIDPTSIKAWIHDAGQPTAHFNVLRERGIDSRRIIVDDSAPLYHIGEAREYSPMLFIVSHEDMPCRYEQTMLTVSALKHFGHDSAELCLMHGPHCNYLQKRDGNGVSILGSIIGEYIEKNERHLI